MATMLTIAVDDALAERARRYAERNETSISEIISGMLAKLTQEDDATGYMAGLGPIGRQFVGIAKGAEGGVEEYHHYLLEKYSR
jgi:hypothetical protein